MPCALVYAVLPRALLAGGGLEGASGMLAFGVGTLPALLGGGVLLARFRRSFPTSALRFAGAAVMIAFGVLGLSRVALPDALAATPFCLLP
jgi:sulfite exporter TauE/SafE